MSFPCTACGLCCKNIGQVEALAHFDDGEGSCVNLTAQGCSIYEQRPIVCRIEEGYEQFAQHLLSKADYYRQNANICNQLQVQHGLPVSYRILL